MRWGQPLAWAGILGGGAYWLARYLRPRHSTLVLNEKVVLITGASSGIGRSLAYAFARRAARLVLVARNGERLEAVRREVEPFTSEVMVIQADITQDDDLQTVVTRALERFGRIDILVNNAGVSMGGPLTEHDPSRLDTLIRTNLWAAIRLTQLVLPQMLRNHHGYVMNVGSMLGRAVSPQFSAYGATKAGLAYFTDALRRELAGTGVHLTYVMPGWTSTDMINPDIEELGKRYGLAVEHPDYVAERAVLGLVHGAHDVMLGGRLAQLGVLAERYFPIGVRIYWRIMMTPEWVDTMKQIGNNRH